MKVDDPNWHSRIRAPLEVKDPEGVEWDDTADVVVVGLGGAGICAALEALPGVGRKTANVVLNVAFGEATMAVDTHLFRLGNRTGLAPGKTPLAVEQKLLKRIPPEFLVDSHHWLILHGRYVCQARKPQCGQCAVFEVCGFKEKHRVGALK